MERSGLITPSVFSLWRYHWKAPFQLLEKSSIKNWINSLEKEYIEPGTVLQSSNTSKKIKINGTFNCKTRNVVYCITCEKCKLQYIGQTTRSLNERVREHIGYIRNLHTNCSLQENILTFLDMNSTI